jgi:hypothetical protein
MSSTVQQGDNVWRRAYLGGAQSCRVQSNRVIMYVDVLTWEVPNHVEYSPTGCRRSSCSSRSHSPPAYLWEKNTSLN